MNLFAKRLASAMLPVVAVLTLAAVFLWQLELMGDVKIDDAYITFSFSKNLALGNGPVYSHGVRVEGYSNFLWMVLVALPLAIKPTLEPLLVARVLTVPFGLLLGWATYSLIRTPFQGGRAHRIIGWAGVLLLGFDTDLVLTSICGLETLPYVALVVAGFALYIKGCGGSRLARTLTVPCFVAVGLMRIDGFAPLLLILAWELTHSLVARRFRLGGYLRWAGPGVAVYCLWFVWRWHYYGHLLPNTYYAKALVPIALPNRGWEYTRDFWTSTELLLAAPFALLALWGARGKALLLTLFVLAHTAYVIHVGGDWMPFWRFFAVAVPLSIVLMAWGAAQCIHWGSRWHRDAREACVAVALLVAIRLGYHLDDHYAPDKVKRDKLSFSGMLGPTVRDQYLPMSRLLGYVVPSGKRLVSDYAGVMAYFTDAAVIDMWGLCNEEIAHHGTTDGVVPIWGRTCPPCYARLAPDFFHVQFMQPLDKYPDHKSVVNAVWQSDTIGKYVDFGQFAAGRAVDLDTHNAIYFLERRRAGANYAPRRPASDVLIEYPFEQSGSH
jgi:arabinofuranosyltransferase